MKRISGLLRRGAAIMMAASMAVGTPVTAYAANIFKDTVLISDTHPWLFYVGNDGDPLATYQKTNLFTQEQLDRAADNIHQFSKDIEEASGAKFILFIVPGKHSVYSEYMPADIAVADNEGRTMQFIHYMQTKYPETEIVYPLEEMLQAKQEYPGQVLYLESDSHWNPIGAWVGARTLLGRIASVRGLSYQGSSGTQSQAGAQGPASAQGPAKALGPAGALGVSASYTQGSSNTQGASYTPQHREFAAVGQSGELDLAHFVHLSGDYWSTTYETAMGSYNIVNMTTNQKKDDVIREAAVSGEQTALPVNVYYVGDSFRYLLKPYLYENLAMTTVVNRFYLNPDDMLESHPDVVVYEMVDRHLGELSMLPGYNTAALR